MATAFLPHLIPSEGPTVGGGGGGKRADHLWMKFVLLPLLQSSPPPALPPHTSRVLYPPAPSPHMPAVLCAVRPGCPGGAGFAVEGRQVLGRQLPGQREQGVSELVAMGTWMLTKAREAVSSHSALLRSWGLLSQAGSRFSLGSTGRRVAPGSGSRTAVPQPWSSSPEPRLPAQHQDGHHHLHPLHGRVPALRGTGKVSYTLESPGGPRDSVPWVGACTCGVSRAHRGRKAVCVWGHLHVQSVQNWHGHVCGYTDVPKPAGRV